MFQGKKRSHEDGAVLLLRKKNSILIGHVLNERRTGTTHDHKALGVVLRD